MLAAELGLKVSPQSGGDKKGFQQVDVVLGVEPRQFDVGGRGGRLGGPEFGEHPRLAACSGPASRQRWVLANEEHLSVRSHRGDN